jgi:hypothetical protein
MGTQNAKSGLRPAAQSEFFCVGDNGGSGRFHVNLLGRLLRLSALWQRDRQNPLSTRLY